MHRGWVAIISTAMVSGKPGFVKIEPVSHANKTNHDSRSPEMFGRLLPKEGRFYDLFNAHAEQVVRAGRELVALMQDFPDL